MAQIQNLQGWARRQAAPVTVAIAASLVASALVLWFAPGIAAQLVVGPGTMARPWTFFTYPLVGGSLTDPMSIIFFIFLMMFLLSIGGSVERDLGRVKYFGFLAVMTILPAVILYFVAGGQVIVAGTLLSSTALGVAYGMRHATMPMSFWGVAIYGRIFAAIMAGFAFFTTGAQNHNPLLGLFACIHLALAAAFALDKIPGLTYATGYKAAKQTKVNRQREEAYFEDVRRREQERVERERLRKLFESSLKDSEDR